jgi:membrane protein implicated in regulation of membrane protease activity
VKSSFNLWAFVLTLVSWFGFFAAAATEALPFNLHLFVFGFVIVVFLFAFYGLKAVTNWKSAALSMASLLGCLALIAVEGFVIGIGSLLS